jgi:hypothetical protein
MRYRAVRRQQGSRILFNYNAFVSAKMWNRTFYCEIASPSFHSRRRRAPDLAALGSDSLPVVTASRPCPFTASARQTTRHCVVAFMAGVFEDSRTPQQNLTIHAKLTFKHRQFIGNKLQT